jgi:hypothetical protein
MAKQNVAKLAFRFVLIIGIVNFFADMTYEGARSVVGPFLGSLGASAAVVGFVAGFGELVGYGLRSVSGYFADKTHRYWAVAFVGYAINMLAVPALALAGNWPLAAALIISERTGRAIRRPAVESMLSHAGKSIGQGWVFGLNEVWFAKTLADCKINRIGAAVSPAFWYNFSHVALCQSLFRNGGSPVSRARVHRVGAEAQAIRIVHGEGYQRSKASAQRSRRAATSAQSIRGQRPLLGVLRNIEDRVAILYRKLF